MSQLYYQLRYALPVWFCMLVTAWMPDNRISIRVRGLFVSFFLPGQPKGLTIGRDVTLLGISKLEIGDNVYIAKGAWVNALGGLEICNEVMLGPYVVVVTTQHQLNNNSVFGASSTFSPIKIGSGTWIAAHCTLTSGVSIGGGCVVGANSVITKPFEDNLVIAGVPALKVKERGKK